MGIASSGQRAATMASRRRGRVGKGGQERGTKPKGKNFKGKPGRGRGRGRGGKGRGPPRKLDKSSLDDDLDSYMLRDKKSGTHKLNEDLDDYFKKAKEAKEKDGEEAAPQ